MGTSKLSGRGNPAINWFPIYMREEIEKCQPHGPPSIILSAHNMYIFALKRFPCKKTDLNKM